MEEIGAPSLRLQAGGNPPRRLLVVADIEGSSGCLSREASLLRTDSWAFACRELSRDVDAVVRALFDAGAERVVVKDFHRSAYNLMGEYIDPRAEILLGYRNGSVPGMGSPRGLDAVLFLGMHASSGSTGFLAHTMTSRIARVEVNGHALSEAELFSAALAAEGIRPLFFSGCPVACEEAGAAIRGIALWPIDKFPAGKAFDAESWRRGLARAAAESLGSPALMPFAPPGPLPSRVVLRDGADAARKLAARWKLRRTGDAIELDADSLADLYGRLIDLFYLTPLLRRCVPLALAIFNALGGRSLSWARRRLAALDSDTGA